MLGSAFALQHYFFPASSICVCLHIHSWLTACMCVLLCIIKQGLVPSGDVLTSISWIHDEPSWEVTLVFQYLSLYGVLSLFGLNGRRLLLFLALHSHFHICFVSSSTVKYSVIPGTFCTLQVALEGNLHSCVVCLSSL